MAKVAGTSKKSAGKKAIAKGTAKRALPGTKLAARGEKRAAASAASAKKAAGKSSASAGKSRIKVRMYRQGLGDCFLLTLTGKGGKPYYIVIDCGVILGTSNASAVVGKVVQNIIDTTDGKLDLLVATHEHWDHVSGFVQARDLWQNKLKIAEVWLAWTENSKDSLAQKLKADHMKMRMALTAAATRMRMAGDHEAAADVTGMIEFFGASGANTTAAAMEVIKKLSDNIRFCDPQDAPVEIPGTNVRIYTLGPPRDEKKIKKVNPSTKVPETYGMGAINMFMSDIASALMEPESTDIFDEMFQIPLPAAQQMSFFQDHYWGEDAGSKEKDQSWRRIDGSWLDSSTSMALALDSATNNTSLVLAFELDDGEVLLFAADAQVGNWLSWQDLAWKVNGKDVSGPDLLNRTIFYKVGHHGSHNATLKEKGLEQMTGLKMAFLPVDQEMAKKKRWGQMPLTDLLDRLNEMTDQCVVRIDEEVPAKLKKQVTVDSGKDKLFYEVQF
jgi:hypothetical protein